ncbi:hypothetical protein MJG53_008095 [Ovis ammon polii x Ovis aries]|uniref:Uncharacterized protein n=1 Tax=Ovis ammon polii x Ovis aries TaxID=2918886 RepID=A0ACB9UZI4_9CETA|nr:hypothetical protein MJG53_008095 [Ovis ammon polii x Ovis aries]
MVSLLLLAAVYLPLGSVSGPGAGRQGLSRFSSLVSHLGPKPCLSSQRPQRECELPERHTPDQEGTSMDRGQSDLLKKLASSCLKVSPDSSNPPTRAPRKTQRRGPVDEETAPAASLSKLSAAKEKLRYFESHPRGKKVVHKALIIKDAPLGIMSRARLAASFPQTHPNLPGELFRECKEKRMKGSVKEVPPQKQEHSLSGRSPPDPHSGARPSSTRPEDAEHAELLCRPKRATAPPPTAQSELSEDTCSLSQATRLPKLGLEGRNEKTDLSQGAEQGSLSLLPDETGKSSWMQSKPPPTTSANTAYSFPKPELRRTKRWSFSSRYKDHWQVMESLLPSGKCPKKEARSSSHGDVRNSRPRAYVTAQPSKGLLHSAKLC